MELEFNGDIYSCWFFLTQQKMCKWKYRNLSYNEITLLMWVLIMAHLFTFALMMSENAIAFSWRDDFYFKINSSSQLQSLSEFKKSATI